MYLAVVEFYENENEKKRIGFQWCLIQDQEDLLGRYRKFVVDCSRFIGKYNGIGRQGYLKCHRICHL